MSFSKNNLGDDKRNSFSHYYVPNIEIKDFNVLIVGKSFFDLPAKNEEENYETIVDMSNNNDYTTGNLLDSASFLLENLMKIMKQQCFLLLKNQKKLLLIF